MIYRQGDVLFRKMGYDNPQGNYPQPFDADKVTTIASGVVAEGEVTGHAHRVTGNAKVFRDEQSQKLFVEVMAGGATVTHEEHKPITIEEPGLYEVIRQREYAPEQDREFRRVRD